MHILDIQTAVPLNCQKHTLPKYRKKKASNTSQVLSRPRSKCFATAEKQNQTIIFNMPSGGIGIHPSQVSFFGNIFLLLAITRNWAVPLKRLKLNSAAPSCWGTTWRLTTIDLLSRQSLFPYQSRFLKDQNIQILQYASTNALLSNNSS